MTGPIRWLRHLWPFEKHDTQEKEKHELAAAPHSDTGPPVAVEMAPPAVNGVAAPAVAPAPSGAARAAPHEAPTPQGQEDGSSRHHPANYVEREKGDVSDKVAWGSGAGLIFAGLLNSLEAYTGIPMPEGLDAYLVAAVGGLVGYFKKDRA